MEFLVLKKTLAFDGELPIKIVTDSMRPLLQVDEKLKVIVPPKKLKMFDLVVFYQSEKLNCHFLWRDQKNFNNTIVTRSLKQPKVDDPPVPYECILGVVKGKSISILQKLKILFYISVAGL